MCFTHNIVWTLILFFRLWTVSSQKRKTSLVIYTSVCAGICLHTCFPYWGNKHRWEVVMSFWRLLQVIIIFLMNNLLSRQNMCLSSFLCWSDKKDNWKVYFHKIILSVTGTIRKHFHLPTEYNVLSTSDVKSGLALYIPGDLSPLFRSYFWNMSWFNAPKLASKQDLLSIKL